MDWRAWQEAHEHAVMCLAELENALSMGDDKRSAACRSWYAEALEHELDALRTRRVDGHARARTQSGQWSVRLPRLVE
jgi:hypothetical protein